MDVGPQAGKANHIILKNCLRLSELTGMMF